MVILVFSAVLLGACKTGGELPENQGKTTKSTSTFEASKTSTITLELTPTPTKTETPTPTSTPKPTWTPLVHGDIEIFKEEMENEVVLSIVMGLQGIVNKYNPEKESFTEYIQRQEEVVTDERMSSVLRELSQIEELDSIKLAHVLQKTVPELDIVPFSPWPESMYEVIDPCYTVLSNPEKFPFKPGNRVGTVFSEKDDIYIYMADMENYLHLLSPGDLIVNMNTFNSNRKEGLDDLSVILEVKENSEEMYILAVTYKEGQIVLLSISESESKELFGQQYWVFWGRFK
mgnify:CR=1 FL=1